MNPPVPVCGEFMNSITYGPLTNTTVKETENCNETELGQIHRAYSHYKKKELMNMVTHGFAINCHAYYRKPCPENSWRGAMSREFLEGSIRRMKAKAFTLIEFLVTVGVIIILAGIIFAVYNQSKSSAEDVSSLSNLRQLGQAASMYVDANGAWPISARYLVDTKMVPEELLQSANDHSERGLGNMAIVGNYNGDAPPTYGL
jgi:competence protein ComGC